MRIEKKFKCGSISFFIAAWLLALSCNSENTQKSSTDTGKIFPGDVIKVGYISYPPGFIVDPNTNEKSGIFNDVLQEIAKRNNLTINFKEEVTWATMIEALQTNRVNLIANPVWKTEARKNNASFTKPVYFSPIGIYVRSDDSRFDASVEAINNPEVRIAGVDGEINSEIAQKDFPKAKLISFPNNIDVAQLFLEIQTKKKDVTFAEPMFAYDYMQKNPGKIKNIGEQNPIRNYANCFMLKKGNSDVEDFLNSEIDKLIKDGTIDKILAKYLPFPDAAIKVTDARAVEKL